MTCVKEYKYKAFSEQSNSNDCFGMASPEAFPLPEVSCSSVYRLNMFMWSDYSMFAKNHNLGVGESE